MECGYVACMKSTFSCPADHACTSPSVIAREEGIAQLLVQFSMTLSQTSWKVIGLHREPDVLLTMTACSVPVMLMFPQRVERLPGSGVAAKRKCQGLASAPLLRPRSTRRGRRDGLLWTWDLHCGERDRCGNLSPARPVCTTFGGCIPVPPINLVRCRQ